jgi:hypothetical protein
MVSLKKKKKSFYKLYFNEEFYPVERNIVEESMFSNMKRAVSNIVNIELPVVFVVVFNKCSCISGMNTLVRRFELSANFKVPNNLSSSLINNES